MAIAIAKHQVAAGDGSVPHDLVCGRGATDNEQRLIRAEDLAAFRSPSAIGPVWSRREPSLPTDTEMSDRKVFSPKNS